MARRATAERRVGLAGWRGAMAAGGGSVVVRETGKKCSPRAKKRVRERERYAGMIEQLRGS
jgi:hypothetical protein